MPEKGALAACCKTVKCYAISCLAADNSEMDDQLLSCCPASPWQGKVGTPKAVLVQALVSTDAYATHAAEQ